jgi:hypothetical protein
VGVEELDQLINEGGGVLVGIEAQLRNEDAAQ